jgi:hypothetical protein
MYGDILDSLLDTFVKEGTKTTNHVGVRFASNLSWRFLPSMNDILVIDCQQLDFVMEVLNCSLHSSTPLLFAWWSLVSLDSIYGSFNAWAGILIYS